MSAPRPTNKYKSSQAELYAICTIGWQSYTENQPDFENFNTKYTTQFGIDSIAAVESAKNLPDFQARNQETETAYILMGQTATLALTKWRSLRSYIKSSFPATLQKPKIEAAGEDHYNKALNRNWAETELMLTSAINLVTQNAAQLTTGGMPAAFPTQLSDLHTEFMDYYATFTDSGQDEHEGTDAKIIANNDIYAQLLRMFEDGQIIYEDDAAKRERFIFARVKELITNNPGPGTGPVASDTIEIGLYIFDQSTSLPIQGALFRILNPPSGSPIETFSDQDGIAAVKITGYAPNATVTVQGEVAASGYDMVFFETEMTAGQLYSVEAALEPTPPAPPAP